MDHDHFFISKSEINSWITPWNGQCSIAMFNHRRDSQLIVGLPVEVLTSPGWVYGQSCEVTVPRWDRWALVATKTGDKKKPWNLGYHGLSHFLTGKPLFWLAGNTFFDWVITMVMKSCEPVDPRDDSPFWDFLSSSQHRKKIVAEQGLVNVLFWGFWTSLEEVFVGDCIPNSWMMNTKNSDFLRQQRSSLEVLPFARILPRKVLWDMHIWWTCLEDILYIEHHRTCGVTICYNLTVPRVDLHMFSCPSAVSTVCRMVPWFYRHSIQIAERLAVTLTTNT